MTPIIKPTLFEIDTHQPGTKKFYIKFISVAIIDNEVRHGWSLVLKTAHHVLHIALDQKGNKKVTIDKPSDLSENINRCIDIFNQLYGDSYGKVSHIEGHT